MNWPPDLRVRHIELRISLWIKGDLLRLVWLELYPLRYLNTGKSTIQSPLNCRIRDILEFGVNSYVRDVERRKIKVTYNLRISHSNRTARRYIDVAIDAHILIRRHRVPVDKGPREIIDILRKNFDGECVGRARASNVG